MKGRDEKQIAKVLGIKVCTVHDHIKAIYVGWTREEEAARNKRDAQLAMLHRQLAGLDRISRQSA